MYTCERLQIIHKHTLPPYRCISRGVKVNSNFTSRDRDHSVHLKAVWLSGVEDKGDRIEHEGCSCRVDYKNFGLV